MLQVYDSIENHGIVAYDNATSNGLDPVSEVSMVRNKVMRTARYGDFYSMKAATEAIAALRMLEDIRLAIDRQETASASCSKALCGKTFSTTPTSPNRPPTRP